MERVVLTAPEIIGLSLSTERRLDDFVRLVVAMLIVVPHAIISVAPGATLDEEKVRSLVDIDLLFRDAGSVGRFRWRCRRDTRRQV